ncbi:MAG TPA: sialidase family protein, partial [Vicinamibacterales bacterium]|nr:sialidase family protein [Vicinamibacterales bacterium]
MNASSKPVRQLALGILLTGAVASAIALEPTATIGVEGRANSYASLAASGRFAALVWGARTSNDVTDIFVATSTDGGRAFTAPARVNAVAGDASLAGEQPPRIVLIPREKGSPSIVVVWTSRTPTGTRLLSARSDNAGQSFGPAAPLPGSEASGNRGWESVTTTRDGAVVALWLDHRDSASSGGKSTAMNHEEHQHLHSATPTDGVARAQLSRLFFATLG